MLAAFPAALHQTDHLTYGGYVSPGTGSATVDRALSEFPAATRAEQAVLLQGSRGVAPAELDAAARCAARVAGTVEHVEVPALPEGAARALRRDGLRIVPFSVDGGWDARIDAAAALGDERRDRARRDAGPARARPSDDAAARPLELVAAAGAGASGASTRVRVAPSPRARAAAQLTSSGRSRSAAR